MIENLLICHADNRTIVLTYSKKNPFAESARILPRIAATPPKKMTAHLYI